MDRNDELDLLSNKYDVKWKPGKIKEIQIATRYEKFEFDIEEDGFIYNMIHLPALYRTTTEMHKEFKKNLENGLTLEEAIIYIVEHSHAKYKGHIHFMEKVKEKVGLLK